MSISLMVSFGLPRHFHLLLCNCLVLSLFVFCGKSNKVTKLQSLWPADILWGNPSFGEYREMSCASGKRKKMQKRGVSPARFWLNFLSFYQNFTEIDLDNSNFPLTRTVFRFPSEFELRGSTVCVYGQQISCEETLHLGNIVKCLVRAASERRCESEGWVRRVFDAHSRVFSRLASLSSRNEKLSHRPLLLRGPWTQKPESSTWNLEEMSWNPLHGARR